MGTSKSSTELAGKLYRAASAVQRGSERGVFQAAMATKEAMLSGAASAGLRPGALVGRDRKKPGRHGAGFNVVGKTNVTALVRYRVPRIATIFNAGSYQKPGGWVISKRGDPSGILTFGPKQAAYGPVKHPPISGKHFWPAVKARSYPVSRQAIRSGIRQGLVETFH